ncbi:MAG TPA: hypothetical protein VHM64_10085 [Candidatus Binatia bacterium]|nr:hypothetical protein [Candidatus Binatia bacterium]
MMPPRYLPVLLMFVALYLPSSVGAAESEKNTSKGPVAKDQPVGWMLAGREGACAPLSVLAKRGSEFRDVESPEQLAKKMRAAGHKVEVKEHQLASRPAVEVRVPDRGLYVMFVKASLCEKIETAPTK